MKISVLLNLEIDKLPTISQFQTNNNMFAYYKFLKYYNIDIN